MGIGSDDGTASRLQRTTDVPSPQEGVTTVGPTWVPPPVDYRSLLVKYIQHVRECEGTDYTDVRSSPGHGPEFFSDTEWAELQRLSGEAGR